MRTKRRNTNIKILESAMRDVAIDTERGGSITPMEAREISTVSVATTEVKPTTHVKKARGCKKDALINTKKLLCI